MKFKWLLLLIAITHKCPRLKSAELFEDQPKIFVNDGNLVFESAESRNISIKLKGKSRFLINNIDLLRILNPSNSTSFENSLTASTTDFDELRDQVKSIKNIIRGRDGILKRLERLENGNTPTNSNSTSSQTAQQDRRRINALQRRVVTLESRVANLTERLTKDYCKTYPCQNGGTCFNMFETFRCECPKNWEGPTCSLDVDECSKYLGTEFACQNGATCINKPGSFECVCKDPWKGQICNQQTMDCMKIPHSEICGHGTCVQTPSKLGYTCICEQGWRVSNTSFDCTIDIDECTEMRPHCYEGVQCYNIPGSFVCGPCPVGYSGNGYTCSDINECETNNGGCSLLPKVECINTKGSFKCSNCPIGYIGDGKICSPVSIERPINECSDNSMCNVNANCIQLPNDAPNCICKPGYAGNGFGINGCTPSNIDPCRGYNCNSGICKVNATTFTAYCECPRGTTQPFCESRDLCASNPCKNDGNCTSNGYQFYCKCPKGFIGRDCSRQQRVCGGVRTADNGTISFPDTGRGTYDNNRQCAWLIKVNKTKVISANFTKFDLEPSTECRFDWLQIHDGRGTSSHMIGRFCGKQLPNGGNIVSTHNQLYIWFRSDKNTSHDGFELTYESIDPICGGQINATTHGIISSPGSPGRYPLNRDCEWTINAPPGKRIQFLFYTLRLEDHPTCDNDYVEISSGTGSEKTSLGKFCSTQNPPPLLSPSHIVTIFFHSDGENNDLGFQITYSVQEGIPGCGGTYTASRGDISSPINPSDGKYKHNLACDYLIRMPKDSRVRLTFQKFKLESSPNCKFDKVEIFDGDINDDDKLIGRYCGENAPPVITSLTNVVTVRFTSDWSTNDDGFQIQYQLVCGGKFTAENGIISSPNYPNNYSSDRHCEYDIIAPEGFVIVLNVLDFDFEKHSVCEFDHLEIFDFPTSDNRTSLGRFCGQTKPGIITSTYNHLHIHFQSDASIGGRGFMANYSFVDVSCGGIITDANKVIRSPMSTDQNGLYLPNMKCRWVIVAPKGFVIQMNFITFELELDAACQYDFVKIFNNGSGKGEAVGPWCGTNAPKVITTIDNIATVLFQTDSATGKEGFTITLSFIDSNKLCGANYHSSQGVIRSPGGTIEYLPNKECEWLINVPFGQQIELNFNYFDIEQHANCRFDGLEIRNGGSSYSPLIGKFCGNTIPPSIKSFSNQLYLKFTSDASRNGRGFEVEWDGFSSGCGGIITSTKGSISSPNHPAPYPHNARCEWRISVSKGSSIEIIFTDLDFETQRECKYDYLEIFDGVDSSALSLGKFCSSENHPMHIVTSDNHATLIMNTDDSTSNRGFYLKYKTFCNRTIEMNSGVLESPNFPGQYPPDMDCSWKIVVPKGNRITLQFSHFNLENEGKLSNETNEHICRFDYVEIYELDFEKNSMKGQKMKYCNHAPEVRNTSTDAVVITFHSDPSSSGIGFRLEWNILGCGGKISGRSSGTILSPNYPSSHPHNIVCLWEIEVDYGYDIEITINDLNLEKDSECRFDSLKLATDRNFNQTFVTLCNAPNAGHVYTSRGHLLFAKFKADDSSPGIGFNITYRKVKSSCGGIFKGGQAIISTQNYPKTNYENNITCEWDLKTDISHSITFNLMDFDIEESVGCVKDKLEIIDTVFNKTLWSGCGRGIKANETSFKSQRNELLVRFKTDGTGTAKGFKGNFTQSCGSRIIATESGAIKFRKLTNEKSCIWTIISEDVSKKVTLTFTHSSLDSPRFIPIAAFNTQVKVIDGESIEGPERVSFSDRKIPPAIISNGNALTIIVSTQLSSSTVDFDAVYSVLDKSCGAEYVSSISGEFASPLYPDSSPLNIACEWKIAASQGNQISLSIKSIDIAESPSCNDNYLEIRENDKNGAIFGIFCGNQIPANIPSANTYWIKYQTDETSVNNGFLAEYYYNTGSEISGKSGFIESPLYPKIFQQSSSITYRIVVSQGSVIRFEFPELFFELDEDDEDSEEIGDCYYYIRFYNGYDAEAPILHEGICKDPPKSLITNTNAAFIIGNFGSRLRFQVKWEEVEKPSNNSILNKCGDFAVALTDPRKPTNITSPGFPNGYDVGLDCTWTIQSKDPNYHPLIIFSVIDLEDTTDCYGDYVKVFSDREDGSWKELGKHCNQDMRFKSVVYDGTPSLKVNFNSDYYKNRTGFNATTILACGGSFKDSQGVIEFNVSKLHVRFGIGDDCVWNITVKRGRRIKFEFLEFRMPNNTNGCYNYLTIRNGIDSSSPFLGDGRYCGETKPTDIPETSSNRAYVKYRPRSLLYSSFFKLRYSEVRDECGGEVKLTEKMPYSIISTPNYPNIPHPHSECTWTVMAPSGERIKIDFIDRFDLKYASECNDEYVELKDGATSISNNIGRFCGPTPLTQKSKSNIVTVDFFTDLGDPGNGFKANVSIDICGGSQKSSNGFLTSTRFGGKGAYPSNVQCDYYISWTSNYIYNIKFIEIDLPKSNSSECDKTKDYIEIFSIVPSFNSTGDILLSEGVFCGDKVPSESILSDSDKILVRFQTFKKTTELYKGFKIFYNISTTSCGGTINADSGVITSPGYPSRTLVKTSCRWQIEVPKGRRIKVEFDDVDFAPNAYRMYTQRLTIANDFSFSARSKNLNFVNGTPETIYTTDNKMAIFFMSRIISLNRGFKLRFSSDLPSLCQGDLNLQEGEIILPVSDDNTTSYFCEYIRDTKPIYDGHLEKGTLAYYFTDIIASTRLGPTNCLYSPSSVFMKRRSADKEIERNLGRICSNETTEKTFLSPFPDVTLTVRRSNILRQFNLLSFKMKYKTHKCGGKILGENNYVIRNMNASDSNEKVVDCAWFVKYQEGYSVSAVFKKMKFKQSCENEYISIYNGPTAERPMIGKYCGDNLNNEEIKSDGNSMFIVYHSDDFVGNGKDSIFELEVKSGNVGCGGSLSSYTRSFTSPFYDKNQKYPHNTECIWEITTDSNYHIGLWFNDRFFIENSTNCTKDSLEMFDFKDEEWVSMGKICGRKAPRSFNSTSSKMRVIFRSDKNSNGDGFKATWEPNCGGIYEADKTKRIISSPGYPRNYKPYLLCNYTFVAPEGKYINLKFLDFEVEKSGNVCGYDNVTLFKKIKYVQPPSYEKLNTFCGKDQPGKFRVEDSISLMFSSDGFIQKKGWSVEYNLDNCGGEIKDSTTIESPEIIRSDDVFIYQGSLYCNWNITVPDDKKLTIKFQKFAMEHSEQCLFDYVEIYNGTEVTSSARLAKLCGNLTGIIKPIVINEKFVTIHLKTDQTAQFHGFTAEILMQPKCDKIINLSIENPKHVEDKTNGNFSEANECTYLFTSDATSVLNITIQSLHLTPCDPDVNNVTCDCDYLEILDGNSPFSPEIARICGHDIPDENFITSRGSVFIRFVTDSLRPSTDLKFTVERIPSPCGSFPDVQLIGNETIPFQLYSPSTSDGKKYLPNINCMWVYHSPPGRYFDIRFEKFELEDSEDCRNDSLIIEDSSVRENVPEGFGEELVYRGKSVKAHSPTFYYGVSGPVAPHTYCGKKLPSDYLSQSSSIKIYFKSDGKNELAGFNLSIRAYKSCSRNFTSLQGRLIEDEPENCKSTIIVPKNYTISLFFNIFYIYETDCTKSFLSIYDGTFENGKLVGTYCGYSNPNPIFSTTNQLSLVFHFKDDSSSYSRGRFDLVYYSSDKGEGCGGEIFNYGGIFSSPMYPSTNRSSYDCTWTISTPVNLVVAMRFKTFDIGSAQCSNNYVEFLELNGDGVFTSMRKYCGDDNPEIYISSKSKVQVHHVQTPNLPGTGWMIQYMGIHEGSKPQDW